MDVDVLMGASFPNPAGPPAQGPPAILHSTPAPFPPPAPPDPPPCQQPQAAAPAGQLLRLQQTAPGAGKPVGSHQSMGRTRDRIFGDSGPGGKKAQGVIRGVRPCPIGVAGLHHHQPQVGPLAQLLLVRRQRRQGEAGAHQGNLIVEGGGPTLLHRGPQQLIQSGIRGSLMQATRGQANTEPRPPLLHRQRPAAGVEIQPLARGQHTPVGQSPGGRQGSVTAQVHLQGGGEPPQQPLFLQGQQKGCFRLGAFRRQGLQGLPCHRAGEQHHCGAVAPEGAGGERINLGNPHGRLPRASSVLTIMTCIATDPLPW
nr:hypothetical protein [Candidatus Synechococcus spongiarum]